MNVLHHREDDFRRRRFRPSQFRRDKKGSKREGILDICVHSTNKNGDLTLKKKLSKYENIQKICG